MTSAKQWAQRVTAALVDDDPSIAALSLAEREAVATVWAGRAGKELATAQTFAMLAASLLPRDVEPELAWLAARAVSDEVRHAEICRHVASVYRGRDEPWPTPPRLEEPQSRPAGPELTSTLLVVLHCCMNETVAGAFLRECQEDAEGPLLRSALRELLRDEVDHARLGWAHLASPRLSAGMRRAVAAEVDGLVAICRSLWLDGREPPAALPRGHGCAPLLDLPRIVDEAIEQLVLPGLHHVGIV